MNTQTKRKECFGEKTLMKEECLDCEDAIDCIMTLYDKPLPTLVLYSSDLIQCESGVKWARQNTKKQ